MRRDSSHRLTNKESARYFLLSALTIIAVITWGSLVGILNGRPDFVWFVMLPLVASIITPIYVKRGGKIRHAEHLLLTSSLLCVLGLGFYTGGRESGGLIWALLIPALAVILTGRKSGAVYCLVCFSALVGIALVYHFDLPVPARLSAEYSVKDLLYKAPLAMLAITILAMGIRVRLEAHHEALSRKQQFDLMGRLTGSVAHDFNNLLAVIMGNLDLLEDSLEQQASTRKLVQDIRQATLGGADLINNLQTMSGQRLLYPRPIPLATQIAESLPLIRRAVAKKGIELSLSDDSRAAVASVDPAQFDSAILNVCVNARDALPQGGKIHIHVHCSGAGWAHNEAIHVDIHDNGEGMTEPVLEQALQPFFSTKDVGNGSGLGLAMVQNFVETAGGEIQLSSRAGEGTRVSITLPKIARATAEEPALSTEPATMAVGHEHVLAVDDEPGLLNICQKMLQSLGYRVSLATNAREAQRMIDADDSISAVFTDQVMPGNTDGYHLAGWIRDQHPNIAVLMTSGYFGPNANNETIPLLRKPYTRHDLANRLRQVLDAHASLHSLGTP